MPSDYRRAVQYERQRPSRVNPPMDEVAQALNALCAAEDLRAPVAIQRQLWAEYQAALTKRDGPPIREIPCDCHHGRIYLAGKGSIRCPDCNGRGVTS